MIIRTLQPLLTAKDVSDILRIGLSTVYAYAANGELKSVELPRTRDSQAKKRNKRAVRFTVDGIQSFIENLNKEGRCK